MRSAVKFPLHLSTPITPLRPVNDADVFPGVDLESRNPEMPTSGDLKSGDCLFFTTHLPEFQRPPPPEKLTQPPMGMT